MIANIFAVEPLAADKLLNIGPLPFTNSMLFGLVMAVAVLSLFSLAARASQLWPRNRLVFLAESFVELVFKLMTESFGDRKKALKHFPLLLSLFVFILFCNLSGLLPGVGTVTVHVEGENVSLLRAFTTDLNSTLAMAVVALATVHVYALKELGLRGRIRHFFPYSLRNPGTYFIGALDIFGEILRLVTLSLRLFGVIYGGEALLHAISILAGNFGWAATLPIIFLEIFFSIVQAYLFMMLTATYLVMATSHDGQEHKPAPQPAASKA